MIQMLSRLEQILSRISSFLLIAIMIAVSADVILRWILGSPIYGTLEATQFMMVGVVFLALPVCEAAKSEISISTFRDKLKGRAHSVVVLLGLFISFVVLALIAWRGAVFGWTSLQEGRVTMGLVQFPEGPAMLVIPFGATIACIRIALYLYEEVTRFVKFGLAPAQEE